MSDAKVIELAAHKAEGPKRKLVRPSGCKHLKVEIDEDAGVVLCLTCSKVIDPFVVLLGYAKEENFVFQDMIYWDEQTTELKVEAEKLRKEIRNLKAQKRRLIKTKAHIAL
jgi:hypothetical protein